MIKNINLDLSKMLGGTIQEKFEAGFKSVAQNLTDGNTDMTKARKVTIDMEFKADPLDPDVINVTADVKTKLAPQQQSDGKLIFNQDTISGDIDVNELLSTAKGQMSFNTKTGELIDDVGHVVSNEE